MEYLSLEEGELGGPYHSQALWLSDPIHEIQIYFASELSMTYMTIFMNQKRTCASMKKR